MIDKRLIRELQNDLPITERPFKAAAEALGISEAELIGKIQKLQGSGVIRKFGAILRHQSAGITSNAMVVFNVPDDKIDAAGNTLAAFNEVSHCYERPRFAGFNYNLYAMTHGKSPAELQATINKLARAIAVSDYKVLHSGKEYKKSSPQYFS